MISSVTALVQTTIISQVDYVSLLPSLLAPFLKIFEAIFITVQVILLKYKSCDVTLLLKVCQ